MTSSSSIFYAYHQICVLFMDIMNMYVGIWLWLRCWVNVQGHLVSGSQDWGVRWCVFLACEPGAGCPLRSRVLLRSVPKFRGNFLNRFQPLNLTVTKRLKFLASVTRSFQNIRCLESSEQSAVQIWGDLMSKKQFSEVLTFMWDAT